MSALRPSERAVLGYLGHNGQALAPSFLSDLSRCIDEVCAAAVPRTCTASFTLAHTPEGVRVEGTALVLTGRDIAHLLSTSTRCVLLAATLGPGVDRLCRRRQATSMAEALMLDAAATALIECVCDELESSLAASLPFGQRLTWRYSCGYGDLPLSLQPDFIRVLDAPRRIGLTCTDSLLLVPQKSVTAVVGVSPAPPRLPSKTCGGCAFSSSCSLRKAGKHCGR